LKGSPLLYDNGEVNDGNWGQCTLTFDQGRATFYETRQPNPNSTSSTPGTYRLDGATITWTQGTEHFVMRWTLVGDQLTFTRDKSLGIAPARVNLSEADSFANHCVVAVSSLGSLIHTAVGSAGGWGGLRTKRSGCSA
jgi:hypothetical protein